MSPQSTTSLELLESEVQSGHFQHSSPRVMQLAFEEAAQQDIRDVADGLIAENHKIPGTADAKLRVVHYTSIPTMISMLKGAEDDLQNEDPNQSVRGCIRMYSTVGSNDPGEGIYLDESLPKYLRGKNASNNPAGNETRKEMHRYAYVASFIRPRDQEHTDEVADNLVFWRSYGREGAGCSLRVEVPLSAFYTVTYGETDTKANGRRLEKEIGHLRAIATRIEQSAGVSIKPLDEEISLAMERIRYLYKSSAYEYEQECRVVETAATIAGTAMQPIFEHSGPPGQERTKRYINNPELSINKLFVSGSAITLGPRVPNAEDTKEHLEQLLVKANLSLGRDVKYSTIPYRSPTNH